MADTPPPQDPPAGDPPPAAPAAAERPEWLPENLWDATANKPVDFSTLRQVSPDRPETPDKFELPAIEGKDLKGIADSPFMATLRTGVYEAGLGQEAFNGLVTKWLEADDAAAEAYYKEQETLIGQNKDQRATAIATWLDSSLPADQAESLRAASTDAAVFKALEALMNKGTVAAPRGDPPNPAPGDTLEVIQGLMKTPAYNGRRDQRDAAVVARVDKFFEDLAKREAAAVKP